jgi:hypothetical protein
LARRVLEGSRQLWRHRAGFTLLFAGSAVMGWALFQLDALDDAAFSIRMVSGLLVSLAGFVVLAALVRCPRCRTRLFWYALTKVPKAGGVAWYMELRECPVCEFRGASSDGAPAEGAGPMSDAVIDPDLLPFTEDELVEAEVLMGSTEAAARRTWQVIASELRATRKRSAEGRARKGEAPGYARLGGPDVLLGLSLLSPELDRRVREQRFGWWEGSEAELGQELRDRLRAERAEWEAERERVRKRLVGEGKLPGGG